MPMDAPAPHTRLLLPAVLTGCWLAIIGVLVRFPEHWTALLIWLGVLVLSMTWGVVAPSRNILGPCRSKAISPNQVALTFDDGPDPETTRAIAAMLDRHGAKGTFFVIGERAAAHPEVLAELVQAGHQVGLHSHSHHWKVMVQNESFLKDLIAADKAVHDAIGKHARWYRPPFGLIAPPVMNVRERWGLQVAGWSIRPMDGRLDDVKKITSSVLQELGGGDVVLLHDAPAFHNPERRPPMLDALPRILDGLSEKGLEAVTMAELFREEAWFPPNTADERRRRSPGYRGIHLLIRITAASLFLSVAWSWVR